MHRLYRRNNFVTRAHENGIFAALTRNCLIQHNTIHDPASSLRRLIRVIMDNRDLVIANNLLSGPPLQNLSSPEAQLAGNLALPQAGFFASGREGDLHLREAAEEVVGRSEPAWATVRDIDGARRKQAGDIGADEWPDE